MIFIFAFLFIFLIIAILLSISGLDFIISISGAASSISNVGPGLGEIIGPNGIIKIYLTYQNGYYHLGCY